MKSKVGFLYDSRSKLSTSVFVVERIRALLVVAARVFEPLLIAIVVVHFFYRFTEL